MGEKTHSSARILKRGYLRVVASPARWESDRLAIGSSKAFGYQRQNLKLNRSIKADVSTTMIYNHVLKVAAGATASPLDVLAHAH